MPDSRHADQKLTGTLAGATARVLLHAVGLGLAGLVLNGLLLALSWGHLAAASAAHRSAGLLVLGVGFPVAWLVTGRRRGLEAAAGFLVASHSSDGAARAGDLRLALPRLSAHLTDEDALPTALRRPLAAFAARAGVGDALLRILEGHPILGKPPAASWRPSVALCAANVALAVLLVAVARR